MRATISGLLTLLLIVESVPALPIAFAQDIVSPPPASESAPSVDAPAEAPAPSDAQAPIDPAPAPSVGEEVAPPVATEESASVAGDDGALTGEGDESDEGGKGDAQEAINAVPNQMFTDRQAYGQRRIRPEVDEATGALIYRYPIATPPGRNGLQPDLNLTYNSQNTDLVGIVGYGWSLDIPSISRMAKHGVDALYVEDVFTSSISGELVTSTASEYAPRIETGDFLRYARSGDAWTVTDKQGMTYSFGSSAASRQDDSADATHIFKWMLDRVEDMNGNTILYTYAKANGQVYPETITYTGHEAEAGAFTVTLVRQVQPQEANTTSYRTGFRVDNFERISAIEVRVSGTLVRSYSLAYAPGATGALSVLTDITETGWDSVGQATALPPAHFVYTGLPTQTSGFFSQVPNYPGQYSADFLQMSGIDLFDVNMDSFPDIVSTHSFQHALGQNLVPHREVYIFNPVSGHWNYDSSFEAPQGQVSFYYAPYAGVTWYNGTWGTYIDVNGDNRTDLIRGNTAPQPSLIAATSSWVEAQSWQAPVPIGYDPPPINNNYGRALIGDVNGDGLPDVAFHPPGNGSQGEVVLSDGVGGWRNLTGGGSFQTPGETGLAIALADVNGDGLADMIRGRAAYYDPNTGQNVPASYGTYLSTGRGFVQVSPDGLNMNQGQFDNGVRAIDMNGDGIAEGCQCFPSANGGSDRAWIADINGDGMLDRLSGSSLFPPQISATLLIGGRPNVLIGIFVPEGGSYGFAYKGSAAYRDAQGGLLNWMPTNIQTVERVSHSNSFGSSGDTFYEYSGGAMWYDAAHPEDRRFAGFSSIKKLEPDGTYTRSYYHQANGSGGPGERDDSFARIGKPYRVESYAANGTLLKATLTKWDETSAGGRDFVAATETLQMDYDGSSAHRDRAASSAYDPANGNLTTKTEWGEVQGGDTGAFTDIGNDMFMTAYQYATDGAGRYAPSVVTKTDQAAAKVAEAKRYYDNLSLGSLARGNLTREEQWKEGASYVATERDYNSYGLVTQERDPRGKPTTYAYDALHLYPETVTDALNHATTYSYNYALGKVRETIDMNGRRFQTVFDGVGRVKEEWQPDIDAPSTLVLKTSFAYTDIPVQFRVWRTDHLDGTVVVDTYTYIDGLGRTAQERRASDQPNRFIIHDFLYNGRGLVERDSLPYFSMGTLRTGITGDPTLWTSYGYDTLGRVTAVTNAVGTVSHAFGGWRETITDARNKVKRLHRDAYDRLVQVEEVNDGQTYATAYGWNGQGKLIAMTDALTNVRGFSYDGLGRRTMAQDLHASADTTFGVWTFDYDDSGNQTTMTEPDGTIVSRTFDDVNRLVTENDPLTKGIDITNTYDACPNGIGRLCAVIAKANITTSYEYDALGNVISELSAAVRPGGSAVAHSYLTQRSYNRQGGVKETTHPDGAKVRYIYNYGGSVERIEKREPNEGSYSAVVTNFDYNPLGQIAVEEAANGTITNNTYASNELWRLRNRATIIPGGARVQDITYTYDPNGNILRIVDASQTNAAKTVVYTYDDLNRMMEYTISNGGAPAGWYQSQWLYRVKITVPPGQVGASLSGFPLYVNLANLPASFHDHVRTDGGDIRITGADGITELAREMVHYDAAADAGELWVNMPSVTAGTSTIVYLYYGNGTASDYAATAPYGRNATWSAYGFVSHDGGVTDSTGKNAPVDNGSIASSTSAVGNDAREFPGNAHVDLGNSSVLNPEYALSVCAWVRPAASGQQDVIVRELAPVEPYFLYVLRLEADDKPSFQISTGSERFVVNGNAAVPLNEWTHLCGTYDGLTQDVYRNGGQAGQILTMGNLATASTPTTIGYDTTNNRNNWEGLLDEIRVRGEGLSPAWILAEYQNQQAPAAFYSVGAEEAYVVGQGTVSYTYNAIGNITYASNAGTYFYEGNLGASYANPHAVTSITSPTASSTFAYDEKGNLTATGNFTYAWDYRSRLSWSREGTNAGIAYTYNPANIRMAEANRTYQIYYPTKEYEESPSSSIKKYVFVGDTLISTVENGASYYVQTDHLSGSNVVTNASGTIAELLDYDPYGKTRLDEQAGSFKSHRTFTGHMRDESTGLQYMEARYYSSQASRFLSQDAVFLAMGEEGEIKGKTGMTLDQVLADPQLINAYTYAANNPMRYKDSDGNLKQEVTNPQMRSNLIDAVGIRVNELAQSNPTVSLALEHPYAAGLAIGASVAGGAAVAAGGLTALSVEFLSGVGARVMSNLSQLESLPQRPTVPAKLIQLSQLTGKSVTQLLEEASTVGKPFIDFRNGGNINILTEGVVAKTLTRITTNPEITRIISAGTMKLSGLANNIGNGNMQALQGALSGLSQALGTILGNLH